MDLLSIARTLWRHKFAAAPIIILTLAGAAYVTAVKPSVYQTTSSYILVAPPSAPTDIQIQRDPALGKINADNPYVRYGDLSVVVDILSQDMSTDAVKNALIAQGADGRYTVAASPTASAQAPIIQITAVGSSPAAALESANVVGKAMVGELNTMQAATHVDPSYYITPQQLGAPNPPQMQVSGKLRSLVAVLALGLILLFMAVSTAKALAERKSRNRIKLHDDGPLGGHDPGGSGIRSARSDWPVVWPQAVESEREEPSYIND